MSWKPWDAEAISDEGPHLLVDLQHAVQRLVEALKLKN